MGAAATGVAGVDFLSAATAGLDPQEAPARTRDPAQNRTVVCMKWGDKFGAEYVNRLYRMVRRRLAGDFRFLCLTDDPAGIRSEVLTLSIPEVPVVGHRSDHGWRKLGMFASDLGGLDGDALFLDLDVLIVDDLDPLFEIDGEFRIVKDYRPVRTRHTFTGNSSVVRFRIGEHTGILDLLEEHGEGITRAFRNEQEVLSWHARELGILQYWPKEWCPSFKHDCVRTMPLGLFLPPRIPPGARVIVFHGRPQPEEALRGEGSKWYRVIRPTPWIAEHLA